jgi:hypothetical protein
MANPTLHNMKLAYYYNHTKEWWAQAAWFYNKMNPADLPIPEDIFDVVERAGVADNIPGDYAVYSGRLLAFWETNHRLASVMLPEK